MPNLLLAAVEYGDYISIFKFIVFVVLFFLWLPLINWVHQDAEAVGTKESFWAAVIFCAAAVSVIIWLVVPVFVVGTAFYVVTMAAVSLTYIRHRNSRVLEYDRVLTVGHIKGLLSAKEQKKLDSRRSFVFVTANNNEVPVPQAKTPEFYGYKIAYDVFSDAIWRRANTMLFTPTHESYNVTYYVDGAALKQPTLPRDQMEYFIHFVKHLADLNIKEKRKPQKANFNIRQEADTTEWEVTTAGSTAGEQLQLKLAAQKIMRLADIGLLPEQQEQLASFHSLKQGLFIISGPKKSGVSTTFYALLRGHDAYLNIINTLEKNVFADLPNITQNVFSLSDTGTTTFAKKLKSIVRMAPEIVGVADCPDTETARIACEAAKDGQIIYLTIEADNAIQAFGKWVKLVGDMNLATEVLLGISNQRLLRTLCDQCKQAYEPNKELLRKFNIPAQRVRVLYRPGKVIYDKPGKETICEHCQGTGFVGRTAVFELITMNDQLRNTLKQAKSLAEIATQFRGAKMLYLQEQTLRKVIAGTTAVNEMIRIFSASANRRTKNPKQKPKSSENPDMRSQPARE